MDVTAGTGMTSAGIGGTSSMAAIGSWRGVVGRAWRTASGAGADLWRDAWTRCHQLWSMQPRLVALAAAGTVGSAALLLALVLHRRRRIAAQSRINSSPPGASARPGHRRRRHLLDAEEEDEEEDDSQGDVEPQQASAAGQPGMLARVSASGKPAADAAVRAEKAVASASDILMAPVLTAPEARTIGAAGATSLVRVVCPQQMRY